MSTPKPKLDFWFEFASTYSYLSAMRIEDCAREANVELRWRPFLLGPFFRSQGWTTSPFVEQKEKGRYMVRDMERMCFARGIPFAMPDPFPQNGLYAARLAMIGEDEGWAGRFTRLLYTEEFTNNMQLDDKIVLGECLTAIGLNGEALLARIEDTEVKTRLRDQTQQAQGLGIFGAPTFFCDDGEMFWGDDRLEQALAWSVKTSLRQPI